MNFSAYFNPKLNKNVSSKVQVQVISIAYQKTHLLVTDYCSPMQPERMPQHTFIILFIQTKLQSKPEREITVFLSNTKNQSDMFGVLSIRGTMAL